MLHTDGSGIPNISAGAQQPSYRRCLAKSFRTSGAAISGNNFILAPGAPAYALQNKLNQDRAYGPGTSDANQDGRLFELCEGQDSRNHSQSLSIYGRRHFVAVIPSSSMNSVINSCYLS